MPIRLMQQSFAGGEISPLMTGRMDVTRLAASLEACLGFVTMPHGPAVRRDGTRYIGSAKYPTRAVRLKRFEFSVEQAYCLEVGHEYIRFYQNLAQLQVAGVPVEVTTPYQEADLFDLQMIQSADVLYITHPDYPPAKLVRLSATSFAYQVMTFQPPPSVEVDTNLATTLTPGSVSGTGVTCVAGSAVFLDGDVDRQLVSGTALAVITALGSSSPSSSVVVTILSPFASTALIASGQWFLTGSPAVTIRPDKSGPVGALVTVNAERVQADAPELATNGGFDSAGSWTDLSAPLVSSGTATGGSTTQLLDSGGSLEADGTEVAHVAHNTTDGTQDRVEAVVSDTELTTATGGATWAAGKNYEIRQTGSSVITAGELRLDGGENGVGAAYQAITTVSGVSYRVQFDVRTNPLSVLVGSTIGGSDVLAEATYQVGNAQSATFVAVGTTTYVTFRNNQDQVAALDNVSIKSVSAQSFRTDDVGKFLVGGGGVIEITRRIDATQVEGVIWAMLDQDLDETPTIIAGAWELGVAAWSDTQGYPRAASFHDGRLWYLGTAQQPLGFWASVVNAYENFAVGPEDDDALEGEITANEMNTIEWAEPFRDLFVGTRGGEHILTGGNAPITASNLAQSPQDTAGSPPLRPLRIGNVLFHLQRGRRKVRELAIDADTGLTRVRDATLLAEHITLGGITQWALQRQPVSRIWAIRRDGTLLGFTFEVLEEVRGWHRHTTPLGAWESVETVPIDTGTAETEQVWLVAHRTINGVESRIIEVMRPAEATATTFAPGLTMDSVLQYEGSPTSTLSGLGHLEGATVHLVERGTTTTTALDGRTLTVETLAHLGTAVVVAGQISTPSPVSRVDVGLHFDAVLVTLPLDAPLQEGTMQGRRGRVVATTVRVVDTLGLTVNGTSVHWRAVEESMDAGLPLQAADMRVPAGAWSRPFRVTVRQTLPLPSTVVAMIHECEVEEAE